MYFNSNVKQLCKNNSISQNKLSELLNTTRQSLNGILNANNPRADTLIKIANIFDVSIDDLLLKDLSKEET